MIEAIDVTLCVDALEPQLGGIGRYTWELARRLPSNTQIRSIGYYASGRLISDPEVLVRGEPVYPGRWLRKAARSWSARRRLGSTVVHGPNYFLPAGATTGIITVHDLSVFRFPETHPLERIRQFERLFLDSLTRAAHVITDSNTVRREVIDTFGINPAQISAVSLGVSEKFHPRDRSKLAGGVLAGWGLRPGGYGLCISHVEPRKKVPELLRAWRSLPRSLRDHTPLVLAGGAGWMNEAIHVQLKTAIDEGWLLHLGHVAEAELPTLYAGAALFVYPSSYEGFGLPPIEAMASGIPVIVSNRSCLPEVCGSAALLVDPDDDNEFSTSIERSLEDEAWRAEAIRRGLDRAAYFTWNRCIEDTVYVYRSVACP
jgi:alpha-1,3-rhamnosyl/mannosyltransferase